MKKSKNNNGRRELADDKTPELPKKAKAGGFSWGRKTADKADWKTADAEFAAESTRYASPLPSRNHILKTLVESAEPMTLDELIAHFGLKKLNEQEAFTKRLVAMAREGQLTAADRRGAYRAVLTEDGQTIEAAPRSGILVDGKVLAHRDGYGFVQPDGSAHGDKSGDVFLSPRQMNSLMNGDRVRVRVTGTDARGRREGSLVDVLERGTSQVVGRLHASSIGGGGIFTVIPSNPKHPELVVPSTELGGAKPGQMVVAELTAPPGDRTMPVGRIVEILGDHMAPGMEIAAAIRAHKLPFEWPQGVEAEAEAYGPVVTPAQWGDREDLRELGLMTIDGADARDFDDAVYAEAVKGWRGGGWKLWVAIADVSSYVTVGSALDAEATERGTSVYFPNNVIPMLPEALSNGLCSLNPKVDRLCMVCEMRVAKDGEVSKSKFYPAVMRSKARLIYDDVAAMLADPECEQAKAQPELLAPLNTLREVFEALFAAREARGAIDFEGTETKIVFGEGRKIEKIVPVQRNVAHRLIEECMIAANVQGALLVDKHKMPSLFRVHAPPDGDKVAILREFLAGRALRLGGGDSPVAKDYATLLASVKGREDASLIQTVMLRSLMQARYQPANDGHFGLALTHYAHFTSPIRRYPDLLLHRAIKHVIAKGKPKTFTYSVQQMEALGAHCSMAERRADDATRDVNTWLKCEFMRHRVGEDFDGIVASVAPFGLFVELTGLYIEGMLHVSQLKGDFYEFEAKHQRLVGSRSKTVYALGQKIRVKVVRVSLDERKIDLEIVEQGGKSGGQKDGGGHDGGRDNGRGGDKDGGRNGGGRGRKRR
ncbi:ribonuclease R [Nevskia ramosa]|uniref:ribonuclease R n=1 Tax=Nevskia ramosa TaxID=64002 RepID=UPI0003B4649F|nr:ribonuclease R [Nevskia ramosa]